MCTRAIWARTFQAVCRKKSRDTKRSPAAEQRAGCLRSPQSLQGSCSAEIEHGALLPQQLPGQLAPRGAPKAPGGPGCVQDAGAERCQGAVPAALPPAFSSGAKLPPSKRRREAGPRRGSGSQVLLPSQLQFLPPPSRDLLEQFLPPGVGSRSVTAAPGTSVPKAAELGTQRAAPPGFPPPIPSHPSPGPDPSLTPPGASHTASNGR